MNNLTFIPNALAEARDVVLYVEPTPALIAAGPVALRCNHINQAPATAGFKFTRRNMYCFSNLAKARLSFAAII